MKSKEQLDMWKLKIVQKKKFMDYWTVSFPHFGNVLQVLILHFNTRTIYSLLVHKTLPKSSLQMHWISVRFYEIGDILITP